MNNKNTYGVNGGVFSRICSYMHKNRIGELLVLKGRITQEQLDQALLEQRASSLPLGKILRKNNLVSNFGLRRTLVEQSTARIALAMFTIALSFSSMGSSKARAGAKKPAENKSSVQRVAYTKKGIDPIYAFPSLFGSSEKSSANIKPFTKWNDVISKYDRESQGENTQDPVMKNWMKAVKRLENLPLEEKINRVNDMMNAVTYITDKRNYGKSDYWATPVEFLTRGGDCEDFAVAKYASLKALGVPEERLRIAIVHDNYKNIPHAVLIVYAGDRAYVLDNQMKTVMTSHELSERYRPLYTINRTAWWLHKKPTQTILASAR